MKKFFLIGKTLLFLICTVSIMFADCAYSNVGDIFKRNSEPQLIREKKSDMLIPRNRPSLTLLQNGNVLISGGWNGKLIGFGTIEIYDSKTGLTKEAGKMIFPSSHHSTVVLNDGRVCMIGGSDLGSTKKIGASNRIEIYDPTTEKSELITTSLPSSLVTNKALLLNNENILIIDRYSNSYIFNPVDNSIKKYNYPDFLFKDRGYSVLGLSDGNILAVGCLQIVHDPHARSIYLKKLAIYNPETNKIIQAGQLQVGRVRPNLIPLSIDKILIFGGRSNSVELYDLKTNTSKIIGKTTYDGYSSAIKMADDIVFLTYLDNVELYNIKTNTSIVKKKMSEANDGTGPAILLNDGKVLMVGGVQKWTGSLKDINLYYFK